MAGNGRHIVRILGQSMEEIRFVENEAIESLKIAGDCGCPEMVQSMMIDEVNRTLRRGALTMWTVCGAAYAGVLH